MDFIHKYKIYFLTGIVILVASSVFIIYGSKSSDFGFKCPIDFKAPEEYTDSVARWISEYTKKYPEATTEEMMQVRDKLIEKNECGESPFALDESTSKLVNTRENDIDAEKLMAGIKYAESQREDEAADSLIKTTNEKELYNNPYIKHIRTAFRGYLDGTNNGVEEGVTEKKELERLKCGLDSFDRNYYQSEFTVIKTEKDDYGGIVAYIAFLNNPNRVFFAWVYQYAGGEYILRVFCEYAALIKQ